MNQYELEIPKIVIDCGKIFITFNSVRFSEISYEKAIPRAQEILNEKKEKFIEKLDEMLEENLITLSEKDKQINKYPTKFKFIETRTCVNTNYI